MTSGSLHCSCSRRFPKCHQLLEGGRKRVTPQLTTTIAVGLSPSLSPSTAAADLLQFFSSSQSEISREGLIREEKENKQSTSNISTPLWSQDFPYFLFSVVLTFSYFLTVQSLVLQVHQTERKYFSQRHFTSWQKTVGVGGITDLKQPLDLNWSTDLLNRTAAVTEQFFMEHFTVWMILTFEFSCNVGLGILIRSHMFIF